jgi:periplasmic protein TonB
MAYADQSMSSNRVIALVIVALLHIVLGYALVTGLAFEAAKKIIQRVTTVDIKEEVKKELPPPKKLDLPPPPPVVAPPPKINVASTPPPITTVAEPPAPPPPPVIVPPPPAAPPPPSQARGAKAKNQGRWAARIQENYPASALRAERQGRVGVRVVIGPDGRVSGCTVTSSSGSSDLDSAACAGMQRYAQYEPALDAAGNPTTGGASTSIVYRLTE